jgi:murein DD-endopeptidase MepM/ murein hydrolase activator NlpD
VYLELSWRRRKIVLVGGFLAGAGILGLSTLGGSMPIHLRADDGAGAPANRAAPTPAELAPAVAPDPRHAATRTSVPAASPLVAAVGDPGFPPAGEPSIVTGTAMAPARPHPPRFDGGPRPVDAVPAPPAASADARSATPAPEPARQRVDVEVAAGDTLMGMLLGLGIARAEAHAAVEGLRGVYDPRHLRPGQRLQVETDAAARRLVRLAFAPSGRERIELVRADDGFEAEVSERATISEERLVEAEVRTSLHAAATGAGVPPAVLAEIVRIFSWDVDYQRETRAGDEIAVLFERERVPNGPVVGTGDVRYARLDIGGRVLEAFRFERDGEAAFFSRGGESLRKFLLRTPVSGARMSSGFGMRRHPILGYTRMHRGIDFAARTGTPIYAAGDGRLARVGRYGGYGNYIRIEHGDGYATAYAHLSRFADGMRSGRRVEQGEVIGYVGSTGRSTGPHLHFEVLKNGEQVDPLGVAQPPAENLEGQALMAFRQEVRAVETRLADLGSRTFAADRRREVASGG